MYLSETDVERIARRVAELLRGEPELTRYLLDGSGNEDKAVCRKRAEEHNGETAISDVTGTAGLRRVGRPILRI